MKIFNISQPTTSLFILLLISFTSIGCGVQTLNHGVHTLKHEAAHHRAPQTLLSPAPAITPSPKYSSFPMIKKYKDEKKKGVKYFTQKEKIAHEVKVKDGLLVDQNGHLLDPQLSDPKHKKRLGIAIYVMDVQGRIFVSFDQRYGLIHHSSFTRGQPVAAAGEMLIMEGQLLSISNSSGHYRPPPQVIGRVLKQLKSSGADVNQAEVFVVNGEHQHIYVASNQ